MQQSRRARRMQEHHRRRNDRNASLNMVSLMDIFTILVFFLLVSAADTEVLPTPRKLELPESTAQKAPKENLVVMVNRQEILLQGQRVTSVKQAMSSRQAVILPLATALKKQHASKQRTANPRRGVTIMGDKNIPYKLLKKIMLTCASVDYSNISLAVNQKQQEDEGRAL